jgi:hypothetical protein
MRFFGLCSLLLACATQSVLANDHVISTHPSLIITGDQRGVAAELFARAAELSARYGKAPSVKTYGSDVETIYNMGTFEVRSYDMQVDANPTYQVILDASVADARKDFRGKFTQVYVRNAAAEALTGLLARTGAGQAPLFGGHPEMGTMFVGTTSGFSCRTDLCSISVNGL